MTIARRAAQAEPLYAADRRVLQALIDRAPIVNAVLDARLPAVTSLEPGQVGGALFGVRAGDDLTAAAFHGGNLLPVGGEESEWAALGRVLATEPRRCSSIVGPAAAVIGLWRQLEPAWGPCRLVRRQQPLLVADQAPTAPTAPAPDPRVRRVRPEEIEAYLPAAAAMFTEELGVSPYRGVRPADYHQRVGETIRAGRAFAVFDDRDQVIFKADIGAVSRRTCQLQGVWVRPDHRGAGFGTAALAAVLRHALAHAPTVSLYVNDFNHAARRVYDRLGMHQVETFATVLF